MFFFGLRTSSHMTFELSSISKYEHFELYWIEICDILKVKAEVLHDVKLSTKLLKTEMKWNTQGVL